MTPRLLTVEQAADQLGLTPYQVRAEHRRGVLPGRKPGRFLRFTENDLETYVERIADDKPTSSGLTPGSRRRRRATNGASR